MSNKNIIIIDYQLGNLFSVNQALVNIGLVPKISSDPADIAIADAIVLPGVGAFGDAMDNLNRLGLTEPVKEFIGKGKPFLGICLGLQLLFTESDEFGASKGLDIVRGIVKRFSNHADNGSLIKVPQIAWNTINKPGQISWDNTPLSEIKDGEDMYFVHSYYVLPEEDRFVLTKTEYGDTTYASSIYRDNIFACQFHPEKSAGEGIKIYKNWAVQNNLL